MSTNDEPVGDAASDRKRAGALAVNESSRSRSPKRAKSADANPDESQKPHEDTGREKTLDASLKKIARVEICAGVFMWGQSTPASLLVHREHGEPEKFNSFADLNGCIVDEMLMSPHDQSVPELVRELAKKKHIVVHVNTLVLRKITVQERYFEAAMLRVRDLADALTSVRRIVWTGFDWKHSYYLKQYRHMDWFRDYRLPAPVEIVGACGVGLIELLHHIHPNGGNSVTKHVEDTSCGKLLEEIQKFLRKDGAGSDIGSFKCTFSTTPAGRYGTELDKSVVTDFASAAGATILNNDDGSIKFRIVEGTHEMHVVYEFKKNEDPDYAPRHDSDEEDPDAEPESSQTLQRRQEEALQKDRYGTLTIDVQK